MKKNIVNKIFIMIFIILCIFSSSLVTTKVYAGKISDIFTQADDFIGKGDSTISTIGQTEMQELSETIYNVLLIIGIIVAVIIGMIIGIKFMTGSVEEKAKVKETLIPYIAGCIVVFGAFTIWRLVVIVMQSAPSA